MSMWAPSITTVVLSALQVSQILMCTGVQGTLQPPAGEQRGSVGPVDRPTQPPERHVLPSATYLDGNLEPYRDTEWKLRKHHKAPKGPPDIDVPPPPAERVPLLDGAPTARAALDAMLAASNAADEEAALMLVDPAIRPLMVPNMAIERLALDSILLERACFGKPEFPMRGMLFWFTLRDLVRIRSLEVRDTRVVDENRVVFTVEAVQKGYHSEKHHRAPHQILTIRREGKWYVFRPYGLLVTLLRGQVLQRPHNSPPPIIVYHPSAEEAGSDGHWQIEYLIPIEIVHEHLAKAATAHEFREVEATARGIQRHFRSVAARAKRGDFTTRSELRAAVDSIEATLEQFADVNLILMPGIKKLADTHLPPADTHLPPQKQQDNE